MRYCAVAIFYVLRWMQPPFLRLIAWCAGYMLTDSPQLASQRPRVEPSADINRAVCLMAMQDRVREVNENTDLAQARLNACLQCVTAEAIQGPMMAMFGHLIAAGQHPEQVLSQIMANMLDLGMHLERRLQSANAGSSQPVSERSEERQHISETVVLP